MNSDMSSIGFTHQTSPFKSIKDVYNPNLKAESNQSMRDISQWTVNTDVYVLFSSIDLKED